MQWSVSELPNASDKFLQVFNIDYNIDITIPTSVKRNENNIFVAVTKERRISNIIINGKPLDYDEKYTIVSKESLLKYRALGYSMFSNYHSAEVFDKTIIDALINCSEKYLS